MSSPDVIVVGGGIVGLAAAYHLVRAGARTLLIEAGEAGRATSAGAGILATAQHINHPDPQHRFVARAARDYPELIQALIEDDAGDTGYKMCGRLSVAVDVEEGQDFDLIAASIQKRKEKDEDDPVLLSETEARELFPPLGVVRGAIFSPRGARVDGGLIAEAMRRAGRGHGLQERQGRATRLVADSQQIAGVEVEGEVLRAAAVLLAAGAWCEPLARSVGVRVPVAPMRGQIAHLEVDHDSAAWPIVTGFREHYLVPWDDHRIVAGATREADAGFDVRTTAVGVMEILSEALRVAPGLAPAALREIRVGLRPVSPDGLPILGAAEQVQGLFIGTGHGALGLQLGPYSGRALAALVLGQDPPSDLSPFAPARFA